MSKVSVIIPVYNTEKFLRECLDSVINQTLKDIEIICVDDGSTDDSLNILKEYAEKDERIRVLKNSHSGAGACRNKALQSANGEYLAFVDSDDFCELEFLEKMYNKAIRTSSDIVICAVNSYNTNTGIKEKLPYSLELNNLPKEDVFNAFSMQKTIFNTFQNWNVNKLFKHSFIKKHNINFQELYRTNDLLFTCTALVLAKKITTINESLMIYRTGMNTNSQATNHLYPTDFYKAFIALKDFLVKNNLYEIYKESFLTHFFVGCVHNLNSIRDKTTQEKLYKFLVENFKEEGIDIKDELLNFGFKKTILSKQIFSVRNSFNREHKIITILGIKIKIRRRNNGKD